MRQTEIRSFLIKYSKKNYSEEDHKAFMEWLKTAPLPDIERVIEEYEVIVREMPESESASSEIIAEIESALNRVEAGVALSDHVDAKRGTLRRIKKVGIAAAVAAAFIGLFFIGYWLHNKGSLGNSGTKLVASSGTSDVQAPTNTKARITLSNGQIIYIDSASNGIMTRQGNVSIVKTAATGIVYSNLARQEKTDKIEYNTLYNPRGSLVVNLTLSDGTKVWLNAGSSLHYPASFSGNKREVEITGEAYFEVAKNTNKEFIVKSGDVMTKVLGTHFNIDAYKDGDGVAVTLLEGAVRVQSLQSSVVIKPGQQALVTHNIRVINHADLEAVMAWKDGKFIMEGADVGSIMRQIARWYNVDVIYEAGIPKETISGEVSRSLNLSQILEVLKYSGIHVKLNGKKVVVMP